MKNLITFSSLLIATLFFQTAYAEIPTFEIRIKDHLFLPEHLIVPANQKVKLLIVNEDPTPEEFESYELNREKIITGNSKTIIFIGPLKPGVYPFFGEFNPKTAQGTITAE
jgi:hypothetical protein